MDAYDIPQLAADLKLLRATARNETEILEGVRPLAQRAALNKTAWLTERMYQTDAEQGFGVYLLHEEPDHSLAILALSWLPGRGTPAHDHGTWAVVAGVDGTEKNEFFERLDDGQKPGYAKLKKIAEKTFADGEVLAMPAGSIHSVINTGDAVSVSLHIYGKHINYTGRSQFDPEQHTEKPFLLKISS
jgi:predicted metal-dependent enzyme (double-stranded beta helix superfamily)